MAQFDVHADRKAKLYPLLLDVQADLLADLDTRTVVPMAPKRRYPVTPIRRLNPTFVIEGVEYVAIFQELAAIPARELGELRGSLARQRAAIVGALDLLFTGA
jgi:toxin CcdB